MNKIKESASVTIRAAGTNDLLAAKVILRENDLPVQGIDASFTNNFIVATENVEGRVIGIAALEMYGKYGLLRSVVVKNEWRNKRVAEQLTINRVKHAKFLGVKELYLITTTASDYFSKFGFTEIDRSRVPDAVKNSGEFTKDCPSSATVMSLIL